MTFNQLVTMTLAASKGGIYEESSALSRTTDIVKYWQALGRGKITGSELYAFLVQEAKPVQLEIGLGNTCGLECHHCFLGYESGPMTNRLVPIPRLLETVTAMIEQLGTRMLCVTDRDALTPGRSIPFFDHVAQLRNHFPDLKFGGVTNGLALHKYVHDLERIQLDYLDISIDGTRDEHDKIRGTGRFDQVLENLRLALKYQVAQRVIVATTLTRFNDDSIVRLIHQLIEEGVQWFDIGPLMAVKMQQYQLQESDLVDFLETLAQSLEPVTACNSVTILIELCAYCAAFLPALIDKGWLIPDKIHRDCYGHLYQDIQVNNAIKITLRPELIPEYWRHTLRITADGYVVGGCEPLTQENYSYFAVGNIQTESIQEIYKRALSVDSLFHHSMLAYDQSLCRNKPCFQHCLGGDHLLAKSVYGGFGQKDPNCQWDGYYYSESPTEPAPSSAAAFTVAAPLEIA